MIKKDIIIIGGGISGLYLLYKYILKYPHKKKDICLFEKTNRFGGRIKTFHIQKQNIEYQMEEGAGRFNQNHILLLQLLKDLHLSKDIQKIGSHIDFHDEKNEFHTFQNPQFYIHKVIDYYHKHPHSSLKNQTFISYAKKYKILNSKEIYYLKSSYGYSSELNDTNAEYALKLFEKDFSSKNQFYGLKHGLQTIPNTIVSILKKKKCLLYKNANVLHQITYDKINKIYSLCVVFHQNNQKIKKYYQCKTLIFALPKPSLLPFRILKPIYPLLSKSNCIPLIRYYYIYPIQKNQQAWFHSIGKTTFHNKIRYMIPIDSSKGIIMISYTDGKHAKQISKMNKMNTLDKYIQNKIKKIYGKKMDIKKPIYKKYCEWECGVGLWRRGNYSYHEISEKIIHPYPNQSLYICGENYSLNQGWIEGALETSEGVLKWLIQS